MPKYMHLVCWVDGDGGQNEFIVVASSATDAYRLVWEEFYEAEPDTPLTIPSKEKPSFDGSADLTVYRIVYHNIPREDHVVPYRSEQLPLVGFVERLNYWV